MFWIIVSTDFIASEEFVCCISLAYRSSEAISGEFVSIPNSLPPFRYDCTVFGCWRRK